MSDEMRTLQCPGPPPHEFEIPKGRGRPPRYCEEHKPVKPESKSKEEKVEGTEAPKRPRPGPGNSGEQQSRPRPPGTRAPRVSPPVKGPLDEPIESTGEDKVLDPGLKKLPPVGTPDTKSRAKSENAAKRTADHVQGLDGDVPRGIDGRPMARITFAASELVPTGQYANVSVGPAQITAYVDLSRKLTDGDGYFTQDELNVLASSLNELAMVVERDVVGVQRNIVLESIQEQMQNGS